MLTPITEAQQRFENLWRAGRQKLLAGHIVAARMDGVTTIPVDYCLSTVAFIDKQPQNPMERIETIKSELYAEIGPNQFFYPRPSLHISLLGCTQRFPSKEVFTTDRIKRVFQVCAKTIEGVGVRKMTLRSLNIVGNQIFIQVFPHDRRWAELRQALEAELAAIGESPLTHPDKAPIHLNLIRITDNNPEKLRRLGQALERLRNIEIGELQVSNIDLVRTDFVISAAHTDFWGNISLIKGGFFCQS